METTDDEGAKASSTRFFFVGMAIFMIAIVIAGFWPSYFKPLLFGQELPEEMDLVELEKYWLIHLHAAVFVGWMVLLLTQTTLIASGQVKRHMRLGRFGIGLGVVVFFMGIAVAGLRLGPYVAKGAVTWTEGIIVVWPPWVTIGLFGLLLALGIRYRRWPETHKRYMLFATAALLDAATARMDFLGPWKGEIMFVAMVGPIFAYDLYTQRRIHPASLVGTAIVGVPIILRFLDG